MHCDEVFLFFSKSLKPRRNSVEEQKWYSSSSIASTTTMPPNPTNTESLRPLVINHINPNVALSSIICVQFYVS